jgi:DNA-binding cell septation regulator SpoVG
MSKICAIHQPNFIPWQGFFYKIAHCDVFILLDTVNIELGSAKSITHRTRIKTNNGVLWLAIPIKKGDSKLIKDILIDNSRNWREPMLKNIYQQYKKATNFDQIYTFFEPLINNSSDFLSDYNTNIIINTAQLLTIKTPIIKASDIDILSNVISSIGLSGSPYIYPAAALTFLAEIFAKCIRLNVGVPWFIG